MSRATRKNRPNRAALDRALLPNLSEETMRNIGPLPTEIPQRTFDRLPQEPITSFGEGVGQAAFRTGFRGLRSLTEIAQPVLPESMDATKPLRGLEQAMSRPTSGLGTAGDVVGSIAAGAPGFIPRQALQAAGSLVQGRPGEAVEEAAMGLLAQLSGGLGRLVSPGVKEQVLRRLGSGAATASTPIVIRRARQMLGENVELPTGPETLINAGLGIVGAPSSRRYAEVKSGALRDLVSFARERGTSVSRPEAPSLPSRSGTSRVVDITEYQRPGGFDEGLRRMRVNERGAIDIGDANFLRELARRSGRKIEGQEPRAPRSAFEGINLPGIARLPPAGVKVGDAEIDFPSSERLIGALEENPRMKRLYNENPQGVQLAILEREQANLEQELSSPQTVPGIVEDLRARLINTENEVEAFRAGGVRSSPEIHQQLEAIDRRGVFHPGTGAPDVEVQPWTIEDATKDAESPAGPQLVPDQPTAVPEGTQMVGGTQNTPDPIEAIRRAASPMGLRSAESLINRVGDKPDRAALRSLLRLGEEEFTPLPVEESGAPIEAMFDGTNRAVPVRHRGESEVDYRNRITGLMNLYGSQNLVTPATSSNPGRILRANEVRRFFSQGQEVTPDVKSSSRATAPTTTSPTSSQASSTIVRVSSPLRTRGQGDDVGAQFIRESGRIAIHEPTLRQKFAEQAWTRPRVQGVNPLPADAFRTYEDWEAFVIRHEQAHASSPRGKGESTAQYENRMNQMALSGASQPSGISGELPATPQPEAPAQPLQNVEQLPTQAVEPQPPQSAPESPAAVEPATAPAQPPAPPVPPSGPEPLQPAPQDPSRGVRSPDIFVLPGEPFQEKVAAMVARGFNRLLARPAAATARLGEEGAELVNRVLTVDRNARLEEGRMLDEIRKLVGPTPLSPVESAEVVRLIQSGQAGTDRAGQVAAGLIEIGRQERARLESLPFNVSDPNAPLGVRQFFGKNVFYPNIVDMDFLATPEGRMSEIEHLVSTGQVKSKEVATAIVDRVIETGDQLSWREIVAPGDLEPRRFRGIESARGIEWKNVVQDPVEVFSQYVSRSARRRNEIEFFGQENEIAQSLISRIEQKGLDSNLARTYFQQFQGRPDNTISANLSREIRGFFAATKLGLMWVKNLGQGPGNAALLTSLEASARQNLNLIPTERQVAFASKLGIVGRTAQESLRDLIMGETGGRRSSRRAGFGTYMPRLADFVISRATPGGWSETRNQITTANAVADHLQNELVPRLLRTSPNDPSFKDLSDELRNNYGLDALSIFRRKEITLDEIDKAAIRGVDQAQFSTSRAPRLPLLWNTDLGRVLAQFRPFSYEQFLFDVEQGGRSPGATAAKILLVGTVLGIPSREIYNFLTGKKERRKEWLDYLVSGALFSGQLGLMGDIIETESMEDSEFKERRRMGLLPGALPIGVVEELNRKVIQPHLAGDDAAALRGGAQMAVRDFAPMGRLAARQLFPNSSLGASSGAIPVQLPASAPIPVQAGAPAASRGRIIGRYTRPSTDTPSAQPARRGIIGRYTQGAR